MRNRLILLAALFAFPAGSASAALMVSATFTDVGQIPLQFEYSLKATTDAGTTVIGLIVENGFTVFGLSPSSPIQAPPNWSAIPPLDNVDDALFYLSNSADIQPNSSLGGFIFDSNTAPKPFKVALVTTTGTSEFTVTAVPEPGAGLLLAIGLGLSAVFLRAHGKFSRGRRLLY